MNGYSAFDNEYDDFELYAAGLPESQRAAAWREYCAGQLDPEQEAADYAALQGQQRQGLSTPEKVAWGVFAGAVAAGVLIRHSTERTREATERTKADFAFMEELAQQNRR